MRCFRWYHLALMLLLVPRTSMALDLRWSIGATDLTLTEATRCTLVVQADSTEGSLPPDWRLIWVADSCEIRPVPQPCATDVAQVTTYVDTPGWAELSAHRRTAQFCSTGENAATTAWYVFDVPVGGSGKLKVVALDPSDPSSNRVLQSDVATFNGGSQREFPPVILRTETTHQSTDYQLRAVGAGLGAATHALLVGSDGSWDQLLDITDLSDTSLTATASLAAVVPACFLRVDASEGQTTLAALPAEPMPALYQVSPQGSSCQEQFRENVIGPSVIQPKDLAFVPGGWTPEGTFMFHLFYIRQNQVIKENDGGSTDNTEKNIGHAVTNDINLSTWFFADTARDTSAIAVRPGKFDSKHVWAPCIVQRGLTYHMFYTGVDDAGDQRMGLATSTDLFNWTQQDDPIFDFSQLGPWATPEISNFGFQAQFRDPFVMRNPDAPGEWLMYFVTIAEVSAPATIVGFARSSGDFGNWTGDAPLYRTQHPGGVRAESPHVFNRQGKWWLFYTAADDNAPRIFATANATSPTDLTVGNWSIAKDINEIVVDEYTGLPTGSYEYWKASEFLEVSPSRDVAFLAAYNDQAISISLIRVATAQSPALFEEDCPTDAVGVEAPQLSGSGPRLALAAASPARSHVQLRVELPAGMQVQVAIHDVAGRRVRTLASGFFESGATELTWDGHSDGGAFVRSGVYFATLRTQGALRAVRIPFMR